MKQEKPTQEQIKALRLWEQDWATVGDAALPALPPDARAFSDSAFPARGADLELMEQFQWSSPLSWSLPGGAGVQLQIARQRPDWWAVELSQATVQEARTASSGAQDALLLDPDDPEALFVHMERAGQALLIELDSGLRLLLLRQGKRAILQEAPVQTCAQSLQPWLEQMLDPELETLVQPLLRDGSLWALACAVGLAGRLWEPNRQQRAALTQALRKGPCAAPPLGLRPWLWAASRSRHQGETLQQQWLEHLQTWESQASALLERREFEDLNLEGPVWREALLPLLHRRDDLEACGAILTRVLGAEERLALEAQLQRAQEPLMLCVRALLSDPVLARDLRLRRLSRINPVPWWASPAV